MCIRATRKAKKDEIMKKGLELECEARKANTRAVYQKIEELKGREDGGGGFLKDENGNPITDLEKRKRRWQQHFEKLLNVGREIEVPEDSELQERTDEE